MTLVPELQREIITLLHGEAAVSTCESIHGHGYNCMDDDNLWNDMLNRDYHGLSHLGEGATPFDLYKRLTMIDTDILDGLINESSLSMYEGPHSLQEVAHMEAELRRIFRETEFDHDMMKRELLRLDDEQMAIILDVYGILHDLYYEMILDAGLDRQYESQRFYGGGMIYHMINGMIAVGYDQYVADPYAIPSCRNDYTRGGMDEGTMRYHPALGLDVIRDY